jgi:hypothetical protein
MPTPTRPTSSPIRRLQGFAVALVLVATVAVVGCGNPQPSADAAPDGLLALVAGPDETTTLTGWGDRGGAGVPIGLPDGDTVWISAGLADVLAATTAAGKTATSDPVHLGEPLKWRPVTAKGPTGETPDGPYYFATWDEEGGRIATLAGDLLGGDAIRVVLIDPSVRSAFEIPIDRPVVAAPPAWIDGDRLIVVTGDAGTPTAAIVDTTTGQLADGPSGARLLATSVNGRRVATMAGQGAPVVIRDTAGWLNGDGSSIATIAPPSGSTTAIAFALDATGQRLAIAWASSEGTVTLAVHDGRSDWRRVAQPKIGPARGAVVAWLR